MKYDKDVALLGVLAISLIAEGYFQDIPEDIFQQLKDELNKCEHILDAYEDKDSSEIVKDIIKAIQNLQVTSEEYNALERGE